MARRRDVKKTGHSDVYAKIIVFFTVRVMKIAIIMVLPNGELHGRNTAQITIHVHAHLTAAAWRS